MTPLLRVQIMVRNSLFSDSCQHGPKELLLHVPGHMKADSGFCLCLILGLLHYLMVTITIQI